MSDVNPGEAEVAKEAAADPDGTHMPEHRDDILDPVSPAPLVGERGPESATFDPSTTVFENASADQTPDESPVDTGPTPFPEGSTPGAFPGIAEGGQEPITDATDDEEGVAAVTCPRCGALVPVSEFGQEETRLTAEGGLVELQRPHRTVDGEAIFPDDVKPEKVHRAPDGSSTSANPDRAAEENADSITDNTYDEEGERRANPEVNQMEPEGS